MDFWKELKLIVADIPIALNRISTPPESTSWQWGRFTSLLSLIFLKVVWALRVLSVLQMLKAVLRIIRRVRHQNKGKQDSVRSDVPPGFQEAYFVVWLLVLLIVYFVSSPAYWQLNLALACYFLAESTVWLTYYTILRRFFEARYSIYHPIEYFVLLPVILMAQAFAIAIIYEPHTLSESVLVLIGLSEVATIPVYVKMIGILYLAFVLSMILNGFPTEKRKSDNHYGIAIIGYGDVVKNRTLIALQKLVSDSGNRLEIFVDAGKPEKKVEKVTFHQINNLEEQIKTITKSNIIWISTPSFCHVEYLEQLHSRGSFIVMEKPITVIRSELELVRSLKRNGALDQVFFLSYYLLEKALPLTYLKRPSVYYDKYLNFGVETDQAQSKAELFQKVESLGQLRAIEIHIIEGEDSRSWPYQEANGGHLLETFLHNVVLASQFVGLPSEWNEVAWNLQNPGASDATTPLIIMLRAKKQETSIQLLMAKKADEKDHGAGAKLRFDNGYMVANFRDKTLQIRLPDWSHEIAVKGEYLNNYMVQTDLAISCFENQIRPSLVDGYDGQPEIIEWLLGERKKFDGLPSSDLYLEVLSAKKNFLEQSAPFNPPG